MRCVYCLAGEKLNESISVNELGKVLEYVRSWALSESTIVSFIGGEPLICYDMIVKIVDGINKTIDIKCNVSYNITTNGLLLNEKIMKFLGDNEFNITFSIDGFKTGNDVNRKLVNGESSYDKVEPKIKLLSDSYPMNKVSIRMTVKI